MEHFLCDKVGGKNNMCEMEMIKKVGGMWTWPCHTYGCPPTRGCGATKNGKTCYGHNTCQYTCI